MDNILTLRKDLKEKTYQHGGYQAFKINDPKPRDIHKASVRDRLIHHTIYRILYPYFDRKFIFDSYLCRIGKGTHRSINHFRDFGRMVSKNNTRTCWILKCDIRKFFASIDHKTLKNILEKYIGDENILWLLENVIGSFTSPTPVSTSPQPSPLHTGGQAYQGEGDENIGLPLGNLTSQLFVNVYMNEFDQFVKRRLKTKYYIRYADDFVIFHENRNFLENIFPKISEFLEIELKLSLHPYKVSISSLASGVDFLGWVNFPCHRTLRASTRRRILKNIKSKSAPETIASYLGMLSHGNAYKLSAKIKTAKT
jgi:RNA-directed DNA polymerase